MTSSTARTLHVSVVSRQRLAIGVDAEVSYYTAGHPYVPGSVLRGALAAAWIAEHGPPTGANPDAGRFRDIFDGPIRFGPLMPVGSTRVPLSVYRCKYPVDNACRNVVVDRAFEPESTCPSCGRRLAAARGEVDLPPDVRMQRSTRTSIDADTGRAKAHELYAHAALPAGTQFDGILYGRDPWLEQARTLWLGGRRTVGGRADFSCEPVSPAAGPATPTGRPLVLRLLSPAVFVDIAGRPRLEPDRILDLDGAMLLSPSWTRPSMAYGWHAASRLPKPSDLCAEAGSTYLVDGPPDVLARLATRVLESGVGLRRAEGFGIVEIAAAPWRPHTTPPRRPDTNAKGKAAHGDNVEALHQQVLQLRLNRPGWRWLIGALRGLQIEQKRGGHEYVPADTVDELLRQPAAADLSGRQRQQLRDLLLACTATLLRDLTTLVLATPAAAIDVPATRRPTNSDHHGAPEAT